MPETRRFAQGLKRKGTASKRRESASVAAGRASLYSGAFDLELKSSEPVDYEAFILKRAVEINSDPLKSLLLFPSDDFIATTKERERRTVVDTVPPCAKKDASSLFVKECIKTYTKNWNLIECRYEDYSGDYMDLPVGSDSEPPRIPEQVFEVDEVNEVEEDSVSNCPKEGVTKRGWLYKAPTYGSSSITIRSFKRRFFHLKQLPDSSYILNFYKDEKVSKDPKGAIYLDSCIGSHTTIKGRKHAFEVRMQDQTCHLLAADSEADANDWISTINLALQNTIEAQVAQKEPEAKHNGDCSSLEGVKSTMHPELLKYAKETDQKNSIARKQGRFNVFRIYPEFQNRYFKGSDNGKSPDIPPPAILKPATRVMVSCKSISFSLRGVVIDGQEEPVTNVEPFFVTLALYDVTERRKISADLHVDLNHPLVRRMIPGGSPAHQKRSSATVSEDLRVGEPSLQKVDTQWIAFPKQGIFTVTNPHNEIFLVAKIEKVLQGSIKSCAQPYMKFDHDNHKAAMKVLKHARNACTRLGQYRMPFAWTAKPLFNDNEGKVNDHGFEFVYKQESSKLDEEDLMKFLGDFRRPDKLSKLECIDCELSLGIESVPTDQQNILTSSLVPVKPYRPTTSPSSRQGNPPEPAFEVDEFMKNTPSDQHINMEYTNHCYVYPKLLQYDNQKTFTKARNIAVMAEFRDSDAEGAKPLRSFYKRPGPPGTGAFATRVSAAVLHHHERPEFYEEWKLSLPTQLHHGHHVLFSFYHVVVDTSNAKKKDSSQVEVGHAWIPLLTKDGRVNCGRCVLPVAGVLQPGYLALGDQLALGKHSSDAKWVDGGKKIFTVDLSLSSTLYTDDQHICHFFEACQRFASNGADADIVKYLKGLLAADHSAMIRYLPTILTQLLYLMTADGMTPDTEINCMKTLINLVGICHQHGKENLLRQYIKYMFIVPEWTDFKSKTVHEQLANGMQIMLRPAATDFLTANKLLLHSYFFFQIIGKSVAQHLIMTEKVRNKRNQRFPFSFQHGVQSLCGATVPHITKKWKEHYTDVHNANYSLATFIKSCFTFMDRGFVFKLINQYMDNINPEDSKVLFELKFEFLRIVCYHEHYIPLNLPLECKVKSSKQDYSYCLSDDYCRLHFLTALLLKNLCTAMFGSPEVRSIAIETFRNLLAKHVFDNRYQAKERQSRIAALYLPYLRILVENVARLSIDPDAARDGSHSSRDDLTEPGTPLRDQRESSPSLSNVFAVPHIGDKTGSLRSRVTDPSIMSAIANPGSSLLSRGARGSVAINESANNMVSNSSSDKLDKSGVDKTLSVASATRFSPADRLDVNEVRSLLLCFLHIVNNLPSDAMLGFWKDSTTEEQIDFFDVLELCLRHFRYTGKKQQFQGIRFGSLSKISNSNKFKSLPMRIRPGNAQHYKHVSIVAEPMVTQASHMVDDAELTQLTLLEANLSTEVGMIVLDMLAEFMRHYKKQLQSRDGDSPLMQKIFDVMLTFLQIGQSEHVLRHAFASFRLFLCKFPNVLFRGSADKCASLIYHALKCCNSRLPSTCSEACALLYLLMRNNYEHSRVKNFVRAHLQMIKSVSQLISDEPGIGSSRFQNSLSIINTYAISDKGMQHTSFPVEVKDLTKKIRTVLMATAAMKEHKDDPEMLVDLQCSLAKSYAATPELRKTWLESMARVHEKHGNFSEAAMCYVHIAALVAEYLKRRELSDPGRDSPSSLAGLAPAFVSHVLRSPAAPEQSDRGRGQSTASVFGESFTAKGCSAFRAISPNVEKEESALKDDAGMQDVQYNEDVLTEMLHSCVDYLQKAERYELMVHIFNLIIPYYEKKRDYESLISIYGTLKSGYEKVTEVNRNGKRMLGTYFRVALYGQIFDDDDGKHYIYKEPKLTQLSEISQRLQRMYGKKYGPDNVKLIQESGKVNRKELDAKLAYIQVTYVQPYFDEQECEQRRTYFEKQHNVRNFVFETPFTPQGRARGDIEDQWKRKTILTTSHSFPYIKKRIEVTTTRSFELKPIEVALDEMTSKCNELEELVTAERVDLKKLQLRLQGSVNVQVNAGPLAYAKAFLDDGKIGNHAANTTELLRKVYRRFVDLCGRALDINEQLVTANQQVYHESLQQCYVHMAGELSQILHEQLLHDEDDNMSVATSSGGFELDQVLNSIGNSSNSSNNTPKRSVAGSVSDASIV